MKTLQITIFSLAACLITSATLQAAQLASAKVTAVEGTATKQGADGSSSLLKVGDILKEGDSVSVTALSSADLVFSNGSELTIDENTSMSIAKLQQKAFSGSKQYEQLQADPSQSQTLLELNYGKLSGHVKKLQSGSSFNVETPLGTAAIRGTKWSALLVFNPDRNEMVLSVTNEDGLVDILSQFSGDVNFGKGKVAQKKYEGGLKEKTKKAIPAKHSVVIRINEKDPYFQELFKLIENFNPTGKKVVITPDPEGDPKNRDYGIIVTSPEGAE